MGTSNNSMFVMAKPNDVRIGTRKKKCDFICIDCFSFLGLGLGITQNLKFSKYASVAIKDIDDDGDGIFLDDVSIGGDSSTLFGDVITLDVTSDDANDKSSTKHEIMKIDEDKKTVYSTPTISTLTMGQFMECGKFEDDDGEEEFPSRLVFSRNLVFEERTQNDEDESRTLNTRSSSKIPSSLDTKTLILTPSLDTKTWHVTLSGPEMIETMIGDTAAPNIRRKFSNDSYSCSQNLFQIERVPSTVDTCDGDDQSLVSCMSAEEGNFPNTQSEAAIDEDGASAVKGHSIKKRLFGGRRRAWSWNRSKVQKKTTVQETWVLQTQTSQLSPSPESFRSTVPVIEPVKCIDPTTMIIDTNEDRERYIYDGENVPFDEPIACHSKHLPIEETLLAE